MCIDKKVFNQLLLDFSHIFILIIFDELKNVRAAIIFARNELNFVAPFEWKSTNIIIQ